MEWYQLLNVICMLGLTIACIFLFAFLMKRYSQVDTLVEGRINVKSGAMIGPKARVVMIESENKKILLGVTDSTINTLCVFDEKEE